MGLFGDGSRKARRRAARLERIQARQGARSERSEDRAAAKASAYKAGIDPNAFISDSVEKVSSLAGVLAATKLGGLTAAGPRPKSSTKTPPKGGGNILDLEVMGIPVIFLAAAFFLLKK